jgi:hypothetical protein
MGNAQEKADVLYRVRHNLIDDLIVPQELFDDTDGVCLLSGIEAVNCSPIDSFGSRDEAQH